MSNKKASLHFYNTGEMADYIKDTPQENRSRRLDIGFAGAAWEGAREMLAYGWPDGTKQIAELTEKINIAGQVEIERGAFSVEYAVSGDFCDVGRYLSGEPECMGNVIQAPSIKDEVKIIVNTTYSAGIEKYIIMTRGAAITALVDELMLSGYVVDLEFITKVNGCMRYDLDFTLHLDTKNEYSRDAIAFMVGHPAFLRRIGFSIMEKITGKPHCHGYGNIVEVKDIPKGAYYFRSLYGRSGQHPEWATPRAASAEVKRIISEINAKNGR
jgi:hypothetical protein